MMSSTASDAVSKEVASEKNEEIDKETMEEEGEKKQKKDRRIAFTILAFLISVVSITMKFLIIIYDIFIPKTLREYVPFLNMIRKIMIPVSEILAGKKSKEISEVTNELDELDLQKEKVMKAYPLRRTIGQALSMGVSPLILIVIPTIIWREDLTTIIRNFFKVTLVMWTDDFSSILQSLQDYSMYTYTWEIPTWLVFIFLGTVMLILSWIVTLFGPLYVIFHNSSKYMLKLGGYRWAAIFQDLENLFAVPYLAAKSSFSFFDAPPISSETLKEFKVDIKQEIDSVKEKVEGLLALDSQNVPDRSKEQLEKLMKKIEIDLHEFDLAKVKDSTSRTFALLIWKKESSILPWRRKDALKRFALENMLTDKEVEEAFILLDKKRDEEGITEETIKAILVTGALKAIEKQEKKYKQIMSDIEANKLAIALALGTEQYLEDVYSTLPRALKVFKTIGMSILALLMPFLLIGFAILLYVKHVLLTIAKLLFSKNTYLFSRYISKRFQEIKNTLVQTFQSVKAKGKKFNFKDDVDIDFKAFFLKIGKVFLKFLLVIVKLVILWPLWKSLYIRINKIIESRRPEAKMRRMFEKELTQETLIFMFQEVYDKIIID